MQRYKQTKLIGAAIAGIGALVMVVGNPGVGILAIAGGILVFAAGRMME